MNGNSQPPVALRQHFHHLVCISVFWALHTRHRPPHAPGIPKSRICRGASLDASLFKPNVLSHILSSRRLFLGVILVVSADTSAASVVSAGVAASHWGGRPVASPTRRVVTHPPASNRCYHVVQAASHEPALSCTDTDVMSALCPPPSSPPGPREPNRRRVRTRRPTAM